MKKAIILKDLLASNMLDDNINTTNIINQEEYRQQSNDVVNDNYTQLYEWRIEIESGIFTGISDSIDNVNEDIESLANNEKLITKNIIPISLNKYESGEKIYTWNVITNNGQTTGQSTSLQEAKKMIKFFRSKKKVMKSNLIKTEVK